MVVTGLALHILNQKLAASCSAFRDLVHFATGLCAKRVLEMTSPHIALTNTSPG